MTGSKYSEVDRERALGMVASGLSASRVGELLGVPRSTVADWVRRAGEDDEDFRAKRREERAKMVEKSFQIVAKGMRGIDRQVSASLRDKAALDRVILRILSAPNIDEDTAKQMARIVREYAGVSLGDLTRATKTALDIHEQLEIGLREQENPGAAARVEFGGEEALAE